MGILPWRLRDTSINKNTINSKQQANKNTTEIMTKKFVDLSTLDGKNGLTIINGNDKDDNLGYSISNAGDINGDGINDIIIGAPLSDPNDQSNAGNSYIVFGSNNGFANIIDISTLDGINGFTVNGGGIGDQSGRSVSAAGDINGDGIDDLIIGAPFADSNGDDSGAAYLIFGRRSFSSLPTINPSNLGDNGFIINGLNPQDQLGYRVSGAGDINQDGFDDVIIAAPPNAYVYPPVTGDQAGKVYVIFGSEKFNPSNPNFDLNSLNGNNGFVINGSRADDYLGVGLNRGGDFNGDGIDDLIIGSPFNDFNGFRSGQAYVIFGRKESFSSSLDVSQLDGVNGVVINGQEGDQLGFSVSSAGDINHDGIGDIIVSAHDADPNGIDAAGVAYVVFGARTQFSSQLDLSNLNGNNGFVINGIGELDKASWAVTGLGDVNGDGIDDLLVSASHADANNDNSGQGYVIFGGDKFSSAINLAEIDDTKGFIINGKSENHNLGYSASGVGDINGDGVSDILISAPFAGSGEVYVVFGKNSPTDTGEITDEVTEGNGGESDIINEAPSGLFLKTNNRVDENGLESNVIGTFTTVDPNADDSFTYSLSDDENYPDNGLFSIQDNQLISKESLDFENQPIYTISVITTDRGGLSLTAEFTIDGTEDEITGGVIEDNNSESEGTPDEILDGVMGEGDSDNNSTEGSGSDLTDSPDIPSTSTGSDLTDSSDIPSTSTGSADNILSSNNNVLSSSTTRVEFQLMDKIPASIRELGVFTVDDPSGKINGIAPGQVGYSEAALARSKVVFSILSKTPNEFNNANVTRILGFQEANPNLRFYVIDNGTTDSVKNGLLPINQVTFLDSSNLQVTQLPDNSFSLQSNDLVFKARPTTKPLPMGANLQEKSQGESIDLRGVTGPVNAQFTVYREASFDNYVGFYKVTDEKGGIDTNNDGTADLLPGDAGYIQAAVNQHLSGLGLNVPDGNKSTFNSTLSGGGLYVPFIIVNGRPDTVLNSDISANSNPDIYFTYLGANPDRVDHVRLLGDNTFGFEDLRGGGDRDYNDLVVQVNMSANV
ncbi:FG-GAP repeat protein [Cylindrospermopsis raciborskii Cr2010]|uniref:DUF4114 domain-containing protein n=1 Tax=Cylindrospermopsis raciborskii TaxID=77022 RepID=UPI001F27AE53|nr:DUF4114 domain-containing protein [Cylindrospermopsis raciborskii]UJL34966.1 FG-GAP repeat protein [Cylindrospermopsis raciborskii Cr2010]